MTTCVFCQGPVSSDMDYRRVIAWERKARVGSRRGGSDIVLRMPYKPTEWACRWCVDKMKRGVAAGQKELA